MEELFRSVLPGATIHSIDWSSLNLLAVSVSVTKKGFVGEGFGSSKSHQLLVVDANRPWHYHCVYGDSKTITFKVVWSLSGTHLLSVEQDLVARVWQMKEHCLNSWSRTHKIHLERKEKLLNASWVEYQPLPNINCNKEAWPELLEYRPHSSYLHSIVPKATVFVYANGLVQLVSFSGQEAICNETLLDVDGNLCASKTLAASDGTVLCVVVCTDGLVKLFVLKVLLDTEGALSLKANLATSFHPTGGGGGQLTDLIIHPDTGGCLLHICYDKTNLLQWSLRDVAQSGTYIAKRESLYIIQQPVVSMACTALCLKGCSTSPTSLATTPATGSEFMLDVAGENRDKNWPVELIAMLHTDNTFTVLNRTSYQVLCNSRVGGDMSSEPALKRSRSEVEKLSNLSLCLSPNGGCIAVTTCEGTVSVIVLSPFVLGGKGFECPEISRWSVLMALAAIKNMSVWDIAVMCSRVSYQHKDPGLVMKLLEQWGVDFTRNSNTWKDHLLPAYYQIYLTLHCCHDQGLTLSLDQRDLLRLHSTFSLFLLSLPCSDKPDTPPSHSLKECSESPDDNLDSITRQLQFKEIAIESDVAGELQGHAHWIIEFAIKVTSRIATMTVGRYPDMLSLRVLRQCLMLIYVWNKGLKNPLLAISDAALSLLFKVITCSINSEITCLDDSLKADVAHNLPPEELYSTLTLTKAANLQGFLHGLAKTGDLPEVFYRDTPPRLRPHVQAEYSAYDPYSPLGLVIPKGLSPPWKDMFVEGQLDVIHGGLLTSAVVKDAKLRQCSKSWTVASSELVPVSSATRSSSPIQQWRYSWSNHCICGALWLNVRH